MRFNVRLALATIVLGCGLLGTSVASGVNDMICFYSVSCGDRELACVCLPGTAPRCTFCTGTTVGNFCFECPDATCLATAEVACGYEYRGVCLQISEPGPRLCAGITLVGQCGAAACR